MLRGPQMVDLLTPAQRSRLMSRVRAKDTKPELVVRRLTHSLGYRFRLHRRDLPGTPDLVFPSRRSVILVHGCFWHRHAKCSKTTTPSTRTKFWNDKFAANVSRDSNTRRALIDRGWRVLTIWECQTKDVVSLQRRITNFLNRQ